MTPASGGLRQSFTWWSFQGGDPEAVFRAAAEIGYAAVEIVPEELLPLARRCGLAVAAHRGHNSVEEGLNRRAHHPRIVRELEANIKLAEAWGVPNLVCFSGNRGGLTDDEGADVTAEGLRAAVPAAEAAGVTLLLEPLNSKVDHPDYGCDRTHLGVRVVELVNSESVKLLFDIYHMQVMEGDIIRTVQQQHPHIGHYHTAGNPGRHGLGADQEINYPPIFRAIRDTGYTGYLAHEFIPRRDAVGALLGAFTLCAESLTGDKVSS